MKPPCDILRLALIGAGVQGQTHLQCFSACHRARVVAVADLSRERLDAAREKWGVEGLYEDYHAMLERDDVDAVAVVTPDHQHREPCEAAFAAGKHVLLEKPMATTVADAQAILAAARASGKTLMINLSNRWQVPFAATKEALDAGELGEPVYAFARLSNTLFVPTQMLSWSAHSALPHWLIVHRLDIARWYFGCEAKRVTAVCRSRVLRERGIDTPDFYEATVEFESGAVGNFEASWILPETMPRIVDSKFDLICTDGYVSMDFLASSFVKATSGTYSMPGTIYGTVLGQPYGFVLHAIQHFVDCVLDDKQPLITGADGLALTKTLCAIIEAAEKAEAVAVG